MSSDLWKVVFVFCVVGAAIGYLALGRTSVVSLSDVTTSPDAPPQYMHLATIAENADVDMSYRPELAELQAEHFPDLAPKLSGLSPQELFPRVQLLALDMDSWEVAKVDERRYRIEAVVKRGWRAVSDDVVIEVRPEGKGSSVHMRSRTRAAGGNGAVNAEQIQSFLDKLDVD